MGSCFDWNSQNCAVGAVMLTGECGVWLLVKETAPQKFCLQEGSKSIRIKHSGSEAVEQLAQCPANGEMLGYIGSHCRSWHDHNSTQEIVNWWKETHPPPVADFEVFTAFSVPWILFNIPSVLTLIQVDYCSTLWCLVLGVGSNFFLKKKSVTYCLTSE